MYFPRVHSDEAISYGGSQSWFRKKLLRGYACGVIACTDLALCLINKEKSLGALSREEYLTRAAAWQKKYFPVLPFLGINGLGLAHGMNRLLKQEGLPYCCHWYCPPRKLWSTIRRSLKDGIPVILAIGPAFPFFFSRKSLPFYEKGGEYFVESCRARAHYVTVTGMDDYSLEISSWGKKYYIKRKEFSAYATQISHPLLSSILVLEKK